ncbi:MAG: ATP-dependent zinc metalloprotease FtsH [Firmicutes bacterium]|nr:ATP-dependent zinc metalloprotease FtsH [Bacillota bacterium]
MRTASLYLLLILIALSLYQMFQGASQPVQEISYGTFYADVQAGNIAKAKMVGNEVTGELKDGTRFRTTIPPTDVETIQLLREKVPGFDYSNPAQPPWWTTIASYVLMFAIFGGLWFFMMQQSQAGGNKVMSFGRSRAKLHSDTKKRITFADVAGYEEVKEELQEVVDFLRQPKKFVEIGARIPKGVLLVGPPGTGKTYMARAVAGEAGVPFFSISGSDFVEMFVGVGASRVRDLFETAKKNLPCIIFIDEIDAVGRQRGAGLGGGHDEREQTLNQLLVEMDGFDANEGIIVMAATNRPDILDPALLRPGRFDRQITVGRPNIKEREAILRLHTRNKPMGEDVDVNILARQTSGFTAADLENLVNEGALLSARRNKKRVGMGELEESISRVIAGPAKKTRVLGDKERRLVAFHEAGHALVRYLLPNTDRIHIVSIVPRGNAGGMVIHLPKEDRFMMTKSEMLNMITALLAGRVAEEQVLGEVSTGAENDLEQATTLARRMVMEYGMSDNLGPVSFGYKDEHQVFLGRDISRQRNYSEEIAYAIDKEIRRIIDECYAEADRLIRENRSKLDELAHTLLEQETLRGEEVAEIMEGRKPEAVEAKPETAETEIVPEVDTSAAAPESGESEPESDEAAPEAEPSEPESKQEQ